MSLNNSTRGDHVAVFCLVVDGPLPPVVRPHFSVAWPVSGGAPTVVSCPAGGTLPTSSVMKGELPSRLCPLQPLPHGSIHFTSSHRPIKRVWTLRRKRKSSRFDR